MEIPEGYVGMLKSKSGLNVKSGILSEGVIYAGFTGSIVAKLYNHSDTPKHFEKGDKITQIVIMHIPSSNLKKWIIWANLKCQNVVPMGLAVVGDSSL